MAKKVIYLKLVGHFDEALFKEFTKDLYEQLVDTDTKTVIRIIIHSSGGDCDAGFAFYDLLKSLEQPVHTHALGKMKSMALLPFLAGNVRTIGEFTQIFIHEMARKYEKSGRLVEADLHDAGTSIKTANKKYAKILERELTKKISVPEIRKMMNKEKTLDYKGAKKLGFLKK